MATCTGSPAWHFSSSSITASATVQSSRTFGSSVGTSSSPTRVSSPPHSAQSCPATTLRGEPQTGQCRRAGNPSQVSADAQGTPARSVPTRGEPQPGQCRRPRIEVYRA
eukprot:8626869-Pyramimonas_sp.AAC.1